MLLERLFFTGNQKFFVMFVDLAVQIRKMSSLLHTSIVDGDSHIWLHLKEMTELEQVTSKKVRLLYKELGRNLITPFDREDIHYLATDINNIARNVLHVTKQIRNYQIESSDGITEHIVKQYDLAIGMLAQILSKLNDVKGLVKLASICTSIRRILSECDVLLDKKIEILLKEEKNEIQLIKMMEHYESLHKLLEKIGDTTNVCDSIIIKYS
jgi:uncharacterized protein